MKGKIYVHRNGRLVDKATAPPLVSAASGPQVIGDDMRPMRHPSNGRVYDSKSRFRAETRARGLHEIGNDRLPPRRDIDMPPVAADIRRAIQELGGG